MKPKQHRGARDLGGNYIIASRNYLLIVRLVAHSAVNYSQVKTKTIPKNQGQTLLYT
jgi:hypothetical protein